MNFYLSNNPGINTAVMQSTHPQQQRKMTMKKVVSTLMLSTAIVTSSISLPTHAAVIDTVKDKVIAIKKDTGSIKSQTSGIKTRVEEISSSVNANIAESIDIRSLVEPLDLVHRMKGKLAEGGIDPAELLDMIDTSEIRAKIDEIKTEKQVVEDAMNGPDVDTFRLELIAMLDGLDTLMFGNLLIPERSPLQIIIEKAPRKLIASIMLGTGDKITEMKDLVLDIQRFHEENEQYFQAASTAAEKGMTVYQLTKVRACISAEEVQKIRLFRIWDTEKKYLRLVALFDFLDKYLAGKIDKTIQVGVHGYLKIIEINPYKKVGNALSGIKFVLNSKAKKLAREGRKLEFIVLNRECQI